MSKEREDLIEVVGLSLAHWFKDGDKFNGVGSLEGTVLRYIDDGPFDMADLAQAALSAIEGAGFVVLPREPEYAQLRAMSESVVVDDEGPFPSLHDLLDFSGENKVYTVLRAAYRAMINAYSPKPNGVEDE